MLKNSTEHSSAMQRGMSHRQQDRTKLYFASSCPWTNKYKSQFQLAKRKRCERGQFSVHRAHSERCVLKCLNTKFDSCSYTIQNPVKIPWESFLGKKLSVMSWKRNRLCIIIFNVIFDALCLKVTAHHLLAAVGVLNVNPRKWKKENHSLLLTELLCSFNKKLSTVKTGAGY